MTLVIEASDTYLKGDNSTSSVYDIEIDPYSDGDLIVINLGTIVQSGGDRVFTAPSGPNSETLTQVGPADNYTGTATGVAHGSVYWFIGDGALASATTISWTGGSTAFHDAAIIQVPAGEFDAANPIGAIDGDSASSGDPATAPAITAGATDGGGKLVAFVVVDSDYYVGTPTGWTDWQSGTGADFGRIAIGLTGRDAEVTNSESIAAVSLDLSSGDAWSAFQYIIREATVASGLPGSPVGRRSLLKGLV